VEIPVRSDGTFVLDDFEFQDLVTNFYRIRNVDPPAGLLVGLPELVNIEFVGGDAAGTDPSSDTIQLEWPDDIRENDVAFIFWSTSIGSGQPTGISGFTQQELFTANSGSHLCGFYFRICDGSETGLFDLISGGSNRHAATLTIYRKANNTEPFNPTQGTGWDVDNTPGSGTSHPNQQVIVDVAQSIVIATLQERLGDSDTYLTINDPLGYPRRQDTQDLARGSGGTFIITADNIFGLPTGSETPGNWTDTSNTNNIVTWSVALRPEDIEGGHASTPDDVSLDITDAISLRAEATLSNWNEGTGSTRYFIAKWETEGAQRSYALRLSTSGFLQFAFSENGSTIRQRTSSVSLPVPTDNRLAIRADWVGDDGNGNHTVTFFTASGIDGPWTQHGNMIVQSGTFTLFDSDADLSVGAAASGQLGFLDGVVHAAEVWDGVGPGSTRVAAPDFTIHAGGTTSFEDDEGLVWTVQGDAVIIPDLDEQSSIVPDLEGQVWLKSIRFPFLNRPIECINYGDIARQFRGGIFDIKGRSVPVSVTDLRGSRQFPLTIATESLVEARDMDLILAANQIMFVHVPAEDVDECDRASAVPGGYVVIGNTTQTRAFEGSQIFQWTLPCTIVAAPGPEIVGGTMTYRALINLYGTYNDVLAANPTYADLLELMATPDDLVVL
jgi:hypothetical protein